MLPLCGKTVLEVLLQRVANFRTNIIVATTDDGSESAIIDLCDSMDYRSFRGSESDVLSRFYHAALHFGAKKADTIIRICSDSPLIDNEIVDKLLSFYRSSTYEYVTNLGGKYPNGLEAEVFSFEALADAHSNATSEHEREHVTPYIRKKYENGFFDDNIKDYSNHKLTLDTHDDYVYLRRLFIALGCGIECKYDELVSALERGF